MFKKDKEKEPKTQEEIEDEKMLRLVFFVLIPSVGIIFGIIFGLLLRWNGFVGFYQLS